jgi:hypothetical protein
MLNRIKLLLMVLSINSVKCVIVFFHRSCIKMHFNLVYKHKDINAGSFFHRLNYHWFLGMCLRVRNKQKIHHISQTY